VTCFTDWVLLISSRQLPGTAPAVPSRHPIILPLIIGVAKDDPSYPDLRNSTGNLQQLEEPGLVTTPIEI